VCYALIEARSCERFSLLAARLPAPLGSFYESLQHAEARHFELYLRLAQGADAIGDPSQVHGARLAQLAAGEAQLATSADEQLRFHSGAPVLERVSLSSEGGY
jgi:tRNA-(ms[2]io[6]A)-hydroxylase